MDAGMAERLAASMDPKALGTLQNRGTDPAVARAVAGQFGSFLMQGMMQDSDGSAMSIAGGTGGAAVSAMFASAMGRYAMSGDKLGLADQIYRSMAAKGAPQPDQKSGTADSGAPQTSGGTTAAPQAGGTSSQSGGISLTPYWQDRGHRPFGSSISRMTQPAGIKPSGKSSGTTGAATSRSSLTAHAHHPAKASPIAQVAGAAATTTPMKAPASPPVKHMHWAGLSLPPQAHALLPAAEIESAVPTTTAGQTPSPSAVTPVTAPSAIDASGGGPIPYGLPWTHHKGGAESGAPLQHNAAATGAGDTNLAEAENFTEELAPAIQQAAAKLGVSPRVLLAQAALETGWGHSVVGNNIFGVKAGASWSGATVTAGTHEMENGHLVAHRATFRSYANVGQAVDDYVSLVSASNRYRAAIGSGDNIAAYAQALAAGGYASDRDYAAKLMAVANSSKMSYAVTALDEESPGQLISAHG